MPTFTPVLFDLDGTLIDSAPGIVAGISVTLEKLGRPPEDHATLMRHVGPPLEDGFQQVSGLTAAEADEATAIYRQYYGTERGFLQATIYPGVIDMLDALTAAHIPLAITTSKEEGLAHEVAKTFGLTPYFVTIAGSSHDTSRRTKALVIREALRRLDADNVPTPHPVIVGDREHDVKGAITAGIPAIAATWGYGSPAEMRNATVQAASPQAVVQAILSGTK